MRILLIEDDEVLTSALVESLQQQRYTVDTADDGRFGLEYAESASYDLLLVDVGLPRLDGISLCRELRDRNYTTPILLMTAKDAADEKIRGLDAGADDYLTKPLDINELHARLRALLRRGEVSPTSILEMGQLHLDPVSCEVTYADAPLKLTPKEYSLLELFLRNPSRVFSRSHIIEHLWTFDDPPLEDSVKAHVKGLRRRLKQAGADGWIENVYGMGYKLSPKIDYEAIAAQKNLDSPAISEDKADKVKAEVAKTQTTERASEPTESAVEQQFQQAMAALWQQHHDTLRDRLSLLQQAEAALRQNTLTDILQQSAAQAAHKLAGVLGMFGSERGTQIARSLEDLLSHPEGLSSGLATITTDSRLTPQTLSSLVTQLTDILASTEQSLQSTHSPFPSSSSRPTLLAVDDDPILLGTLSPLLEPWGFSITTLADSTKFWQTLTKVDPDLLILDIEMPGPDGIELCHAVRNDPRDGGHWQSLPILFLTARENAAAEVFAAGADDYVVKPIVGPELITRINNRLERARLLKRLSSRDAQTGLVNQVQSQQDFQSLIRQGRVFTFVLLRVVNLAQINLAYGHSAGHHVLKAWGNAIAAHLSGAIASYWGNGEFVVGLPEITGPEVENKLAPLLKTFRQQVFTASEVADTKTTLPDSNNRFQPLYAVGTATFPEQNTSLHDMYQTAYANLK
ncbi:response regulator receiver domain protein [Synechococcus sp. PCC 7335]|uniref:response regulator n=1 Tax=Synechococcus sp. (strain ATCC 29403 / PCC 7335) TaxID=91464 RepID=UPI00017ECB0F|nr:response regulator [Synechococcus sp. PCC 7335]EDX85750.1 response regulator receiver domain protein [Synechococcus sp. PCC 7335]